MKSSSITRTSPMSRQKAALKSGEKKLRARKCSVRGCKEPATTFTGLKGWCSPEHGAVLGLEAIAKKKQQSAKEERKSDKVRKEALMGYWDWIAAVQEVFNRYIRLRDAGKLCIDCGKPFEPQKFGGSMDAGHYLSRGSAHHLRFDERNVHGQRKNCNRPGGATREAFRNGMITRIGLEAVEALESDQASREWTIPELKALKAHYLEKIKQLKRTRGDAC